MKRKVIYRFTKKPCKGSRDLATIHNCVHLSESIPLVNGTIGPSIFRSIVCFTSTVRKLFLYSNEKLHNANKIRHSSLSKYVLQDCELSAGLRTLGACPGVSTKKGLHKTTHIFLNMAISCTCTRVQRMSYLSSCQLCKFHFNYVFSTEVNR